MNERTRRIPLICTLLGLGPAMVGSSCARTAVTGGLDTSYNAGDPTRDVAFWHRLPERPAVTNDEGIHGLLSYTESGTAPTYSERVALAIEKGLIPPGFGEPPDSTFSRGTLAFGIARVIGIKGGVMMKLTGGSGRYATRELTYLGILPEGSTDNQSISGLEYVGVISKAQDYATVRGTRFEPLQQDR